ncbi:hypothetical protein [Azospirillum isscasi]|uniref:VCBS repeat-containing protein n=1 Tax=Azospirillum isscasi TaxID=3053926 RepID=A0ABU0WJE7_9PROT|nr:hypothetical protein [Azospirillum isscasi]MDQ2104338.1 hypothetical protein [Azospirillum isscasi]
MMRFVCVGAVMIASSTLAATGVLAAGPGATPVIAEITADLDGDGVPDRAVLADADSEVGLAVYLSVGGRLPAEPTVYNPAIGWSGGIAGQTPALTVNARGALVAVFENASVGRNRWSQRLTIAFRKGELVVAGYTYAARDTLDPKGGGNCDINFLSGKGTRNGKTVTVSSGPVPLAAWSDQSIPAACTF